MTTNEDQGLKLKQVFMKIASTMVQEKPKKLSKTPERYYTTTPEPLSPMNANI